MLTSCRVLPRGIALVRVETRLGTIVVCSSDLTGDEVRIARVAAFQKVRDGAIAVVISMIELALLLEEIA